MYTYHICIHIQFEFVLKQGASPQYSIGLYITVITAVQYAYTSQYHRGTVGLQDGHHCSTVGLQDGHNRSTLGVQDGHHRSTVGLYHFHLCSIAGLYLMGIYIL